MTNAAGRLSSVTITGNGNELSGVSQARILVVDDDRDVAGLVRRELMSLGFTADAVEFAEDAAPAVERLLSLFDIKREVDGKGHNVCARRRNNDLVLVDLFDPQVDLARTVVQRIGTTSR